MDWGLYKKIIDEVKDYAYDVYLHHRGEPLMHPRFPDMISYAREAGLKVKFHTNGTLFTPELSERILNSGPDLVSFSVDGFTKNTYEKIRVNADFDKTMENLSVFLQKKRAKGLSLPYTIIEEIDFPQFRTPEDGENRKKFSARFRKLGLDEMIFKKLYNWAGYLKMDGMDKVERTYTACTFLWYASVILWDGSVSPCPQDFYAKLKLGSVKEKSLREVWNGPEYKELREKMVSSVDEISPCNECDRLSRKKVGGIPFQYLFSYLNDNIIGYGKLRKLLGSYERNE
jgi:radical SAM protein with 4Fe4S-binding SPASM domain